MRRSTVVGSLFRVFSAGSVALVAATAILACGDYGTSVAPFPPGYLTRVNVAAIRYTMSDSAKLGLYAIAAGNRMVPIGISADLLAPKASASVAAEACGGTGFAGYSESRVPSDALANDSLPEKSPKFSVAAKYISDDGVILADSMPIGFNFTFYGNTYNKVNIFMNGFLMFGPVPSMNLSGSAVGGPLPDPANPNNIIALAWTDWAPHKTTDPILFETRGTAPNRRFIVQYNNVPELSGTGRLMGQIVLYEGSNDIVIYTNQMSVSNSMHFVTQGIENLSGGDAKWDSVLNVNTGIWSRRVRNFFSLNNDAIRFSLVSTKDDLAPSITQPENLEANNDPGLATALVAVVPPGATDNCSAASVSGVRSDFPKTLTDPYPVGVTTITWTATDAQGNYATVTQTVTVFDKEAPVWDPDFGTVFTVNATSPTGGVAHFDNLPVRDNVGVTAISCEPASGSTFPIGSTPVLCAASDAAGNSASKPLTVIVVNAHDQIGNLIAYVRGLGLPDGTAQPVINQLLAAYDETADGFASCKKMYDFMTMTQKKDSNITSPDVQYMLDQASRILAVMGCPPSRNSTLVTPGRKGN